MPVVRLTCFGGKARDMKAKVATEITDSIVRNTGTDAKYISVVFEDVAPSGWDGGGRLFAGPTTAEGALDLNERAER